MEQSCIFKYVIIQTDVLKCKTGKKGTASVNTDSQ